MTFKPKLPAFLSRMKTPAGETLMARKLPDSGKTTSGKGTIPFSRRPS
jgi:hypothetical protein